MEHAVRGADFLVEIREDREGDVLLLAEAVGDKGTVDRNAQDLGVEGVPVAPGVPHVTHLVGADRAECEREEQQDHLLPADPGFDLLARLGGQLDGRGWVSLLERHDLLPKSKCPEKRTAVEGNGRPQSPPAAATPAGRPMVRRRNPQPPPTVWPGD